MSEPDSNPEKRIALFQRKEVRRVIPNAEISKATFGLSPLVGSAKRGADEWRDGWNANQAGERCSLSSGERAGVRASVKLTYFGNARRELEKNSGRKVVTKDNYLGLTQAATKAKRIKE